MAQRASTKVVRAWLARWAAAHPRWQGARPYAPLLLVLGSGGIAAFVAGEAFVEIAERFRLTTSLVYRADRAVNAAVAGARVPGLTALLDAATLAGSPPAMSLAAAVTAAVLLLRGRRAAAAFIAVTGAGGALLNLGLKAIFERVRPPAAAAIAAAQGYSFPSGHAMGSLVVLGSIAYLALRLAASWRLKSALLAALATLVLLVGLSRVYLGVHWISDIAGGWCAGAVWLATAIVALETYLRMRQLDSERARPPEIPRGVLRPGQCG
ncbi:MAG: phosphatase PAP2 family protein [Acidobacteria bacterium]|nr:phosphatase PAP2 family protein [Acidobacteriota bacterium]